MAGVAAPYNKEQSSCRGRDGGVQGACRIRGEKGLLGVEP